jgi:four helix bundle protein
MSDKTIKGHKDLDVWKRSIDLVLQIYKVTDTFPKHELYTLTSQMRKAAVSIPSNIAEGAGRKNRKEFIQFLYVSLGSLAELETQLIIAEKLGYFPSAEPYETAIVDIKKMLNGLIGYLRDSKA